MKKYTFILVLIAIVNYSSFAQLTFQIVTSGPFVLGTDAVKETFDGGYITLGQYYPLSGQDIGLMKSNDNGVQWCKILHQTCTFHGYYSVEQTTDSGFIAAGAINMGVGSASRIFLARFNVNGDTLWTRTIGSVLYNGTFHSQAYCVKQTSDGNFILTGRVNNGVGLIKLNTSGDTLWTRNYRKSLYNDYSYGEYVQQTSDGGYIIGGSANSIGTYENLLMIKTDSIGNMQWRKCYGGPNQESGRTIRLTSDQGYIMVGYGSNGSNGDIYVIKTDSAGNLTWANLYGGSGAELGTSIEQTSDGGYIIGGKSNSFSISGDQDLYVIKINANGNVIWSKTYGGTNDELNASVHQTSGHGYLIAGYDNYSFAYFNYLIKTDSNGVSGCNEMSVTTPVVNVNPSLFTDSFSVTSIDSLSITTAYTVTTGTLPVTRVILCGTVGENEYQSNNRIVIYPDPAEDFFNIKCGQLILFTLYDSFGHEFIRKYFNGVNKIETVNMPNGIYFWKATSANAPPAYGKIILIK